MASSKFIPQTGEKILKELRDCEFIREGWRGKIYKGVLDGIEVVVKIARTPSLSENIRREGEIIEIANSSNIGPRLILYGYDFVVEEFINGCHLKEMLDRKDIIYDVLYDLLLQARTLDELMISKDEMHRPYTNVIVVERRPVLIDFESAKITKRPKNVTQLFSFILSFLRFELSLKEFEECIDLMRRYKSSYLDHHFEAMCEFLKRRTAKTEKMNEPR